MPGSVKCPGIDKAFGHDQLLELDNGRTAEQSQADMLLRWPHAVWIDPPAIQTGDQLPQSSSAAV